MCAHAQHEHAPTMALLTMALLTMAQLTMALVTMAPLTMALLPMAHMSSTSTPPPTGTPQEKRTAPQGSSSAAAALSACSASMAPLGTCGHRRVLLRLQACLTTVEGLSVAPLAPAPWLASAVRGGCRAQWREWGGPPWPIAASPPSRWPTPVACTSPAPQARCGSPRVPA